MSNNEHERLLSTASTTVGTEDNTSIDEESLKPIGQLPATPLPKRQMFVIGWMRFSEPISYNLIFPFINQMIESVGISNPGYSSGLVEGTFAFAQLCTVYYWGSLSDRIGRRPVLLLGLAGVALFTSLFGLSKFFAAILVFRFLIGACNGNVAILKSAIAELTDETNQGRAFSFLSLSFTTGTIAAPIIGGFLARPAEQYPGVFGNWTLFTTYPYLLPCLAGAAITMFGWLAGYFLFEETLGGVRHTHMPITSSSASTGTVTPQNYGSISNGRDTVLPAEEEQPTPATTTDQRMTASEIVRDPIIRRVLVSYIFMALVTTSIQAVWILWLYVPIAKGGVGCTTFQIGIILSCAGVLGTFINLVVFPPLQRRIGTVVLYQAGMRLQVVMVILFPFVSKLATWDAEATGGTPGLRTKMGIAAMVLTSRAGNVVFACNMILVSRSPPSRTSLGAVNGVAQMVASSVRTVGPTLATILFAVSTDPKFHALGGQLIWVYMALVALAGVYASSKVQEGRNEV